MANDLIDGANGNVCLAYERIDRAKSILDVQAAAVSEYSGINHVDDDYAVELMEHGLQQLEDGIGEAKKELGAVNECLANAKGSSKAIDWLLSRGADYVEAAGSHLKKGVE